MYQLYLRQFRRMGSTILILFIPTLLLSQDFTNFKSAKPVSLNGTFEARSSFYNASGIANRRDPFSYTFSGSPIITLYDWSIPFSFTFSEEQKSFQQPFNQFGMSPTYKWVTLHAGYRNLNFSPYTLAGHTMLGGGVELNPGKLRVAFMYGRLNRATVIDTTTQALVPFSFSRKGIAAKIGYGTLTDYFDLSFLRAKDDSTTRPLSFLPDSTNVLAASNSVLGYKTRFTLFEKIYFESDGAISLYTKDINSPIQFDGLKNKMNIRLRDAFDLNGSSEFYTALNVGFGYAERYYGIKLNYKRIEPNFKTMGAYYFSNDLESYTINPSFSLPSGLIRGNVNIGIQRDNILNQKQATNRRFIGAAILSSQFTDRLGMDINYSNFSNNQAPKTVSFADSLKIVQTTQVISIMPRYSIIGQNFSHMIMLSANLSGMKDFNNYFGDEAESRNISTNQYFINYTISIPQKRMSLFTNINYTSLDRGDAVDSYSGVSLGGNYSIPSNKAQFGLNSSFMQGKTEGAGKSLIINASLNANYRVDSKQSIRAQVFLTNNNPGSAITNMSPSFTETRGEIAYQFTF